MATITATKDEIVIVCDCKRTHTITEKANKIELTTKEPDAEPEEEGIFQRITRGK
jgi:hypothetical protein